MSSHATDTLNTPLLLGNILRQTDITLEHLSETNLNAICLMSLVCSMCIYRDVKSTNCVACGTWAAEIYINLTLMLLNDVLNSAHSVSWMFHSLMSHLNLAHNLQNIMSFVTCSLCGVVLKKRVYSVPLIPRDEARGKGRGSSPTGGFISYTFHSDCGPQ